MGQTNRTDLQQGPASQLAERVKELHCLYDVARLFNRNDLDLPAVLREFVGIVPLAWQHPAICRAAISMDGRTTCTEGFRATEWMQSEPILVGGERKGTLAVCYLEARPDCDEGPFLDEERFRDFCEYRLQDVGRKKFTPRACRAFLRKCVSLHDQGYAAATPVCIQ